MSALLLLLLASPGTIRVSVEGDGVEVLALQDGYVRARAAAVDGVALLRGLPRGSYDVFARSAGRASTIERGVRTVHDGPAEGFDVRFALQPAHELSVRTQEGATVWSGGRALPPHGFVLPAGLHRIVVDHPQRVSSVERLLRVGGPLNVDLPLEPGLVVVGRVRDAQGMPVPGARVEALADGYPTGRRTHSADDGSFGLGGFRGEAISVRVTALHYGEALRRVLYFPGEERARVEVILHPGSGVALDVRNARGRPAFGAEAVLLPGWYERVLEEPRLRANHDPQIRHGGYRPCFHGLVPGRKYRVLVTAPGHLPSATAPFQAPAAGRVLQLPVLTLGAGAAVWGTVRPVRPGLVVVCEGPDGRDSSRTDRSGRFRFEGLDPGEHFLFVRDVDETRVRADLAPGQRTEIILETAPSETARTLSGVVLDADGLPLEGAEVRTAGRLRVTDAQGEFRVEGLPSGGREHVSVVISPGAGCRAFIEDPHLPRTEAKVRVNTRLKVQLPRSGTLLLRLDSGGLPLTRATLFLSGSYGWQRRHRLPRRLRKVEIPELPLGTYEVDVSAPGLLGSGGAVVTLNRKAPKEPVVIPLIRGRSVAGRVVRRSYRKRPGGAPIMIDEPVRHAWVTLLDADPRRVLATTPVEEDGTFVLEGLPHAAVALCAGAPGAPVVAVRADLAQGDLEGLVLAFREAVEAAVLVTGEQGAPLPQARIRVLHELGVDMRDVTAMGRFRRVAAEDADFLELSRCFDLERRPTGRIAAAFLSPGSYRFIIEAEGYRPVRIGVRARDPRTVEGLRALPGVPKDWAAPVQLVPAPSDGSGSKD
ncbi:MAG: carboxypeptidase regulatory-like domain-containing protein [Planctomycetota bacterium]